MDIFQLELSRSHMSYVFKILLLAILFSGCASNQFITDKNEFKNKVFSKTIEVDTNYQKLAHCIDAKLSGIASITDIKTFDELGVIEWKASRASAHYIMAIIEFKKVLQNKTQASLYSSWEEKSGIYSSRLGVPLLENDIKSCVDK